MNFDDPNLKLSGGVVEFSVWPLRQDIIIDGPARWRRAASFLLGTEPVVITENWKFLRATEYLDQLMTPELREGHSSYRHLRDETGPIGDAPKIRTRGER